MLSEPAPVWAYGAAGRLNLPEAPPPGVGVPAGGPDDAEVAAVADVGRLDELDVGRAAPVLLEQELSASSNRRAPGAMTVTKATQQRPK